MRLARVKIKEKIRRKDVWIHDDGNEKCMQNIDLETFLGNVAWEIVR
jgi:hypothetical protein